MVGVKITIGRIYMQKKTNQSAADEILADFAI